MPLKLASSGAAAAERPDAGASGAAVAGAAANGWWGKRRAPWETTAELEVSGPPWFAAGVATPASASALGFAVLRPEGRPGKHGNRRGG